MSDKNNKTTCLRSSFKLRLVSPPVCNIGPSKRLQLSYIHVHVHVHVHAPGSRGGLDYQMYYTGLPFFFIIVISSYEYCIGLLKMLSSCGGIGSIDIIYYHHCFLNTNYPVVLNLIKKMMHVFSEVNLKACAVGSLTGDPLWCRGH